MVADIKLENDVVLVEDFGPEPAKQIRQLKVKALDIVLDAPDRRKNQTGDRRALVHDDGDKLTINYGNDYPGGVNILGKVELHEIENKYASFKIGGKLEKVNNEFSGLLSNWLGSSSLHCLYAGILLQNPKAPKNNPMGIALAHNEINELVLNQLGHYKGGVRVESGLNVGGTGKLDAAIHVQSSYGGFDRLLQMQPTGASKPGLNLLASTDKSSAAKWWAWGVDTDNKWKIQPGISFSGTTGLFVDPSGKVGIGTTSPSAMLDVKGDVKGKVFITGGADCAEEFDVAGAESVAPGTVMVIDRNGALRPSEQAYDKKVAGVISGAGDLHPGITLDRQNNKTNRLPLALTGKVYCKIDAQFGSVDLGDLLTTSPTCGHAMKADDPFKAFGSVIGKALAAMESGCGLIPILVALQ